MQNMHSKFCCGLVAEFGVILMVSVTSSTRLVVRGSGMCWRCHDDFLFSRACSLATELPDASHRTLLSVDSSPQRPEQTGFLR